MSPSDAGLENIRNVYLLTLHELLYCTCYAVLKSSRNGCNTLCPSFSPLSLLLSPSPTHSLAHCWHSFMYFPRNYIIVAMLSFLFILSLFSNSFLTFSFFYFYLLACSLTSISRALIHLFVHLLAHSRAHYFTHTFTRSLYSLTHSPSHSFPRSPTRSTTHSFTHSPNHSLFLSLSLLVSLPLSLPFSCYVFFNTPCFRIFIIPFIIFLFSAHSI